MNYLANWLTPSAMHTLGWTLLHFLWQGAALAALAALLLTFCRSASVRYAAGLGTLALMLAAPVATFMFLTSTATGPGAESTPSQQTASVLANSILTATQMAPAKIAPSLDSFPLLVEAWLLGIAFFSLRSAGGFLLLERDRRRKSNAVNAPMLSVCLALQKRLGIRRAIRYCECAWLQAPAVIGWLRPVVLLPVTAITGLSEDQLQSVIAHELAHIRRLDAFVNVFQIAAETLLFYHPAIWWLNQRIRAEREHCCDDIAIALCGNPLEYARALTIMEEWRSAPTFAMAANRGPLSHRIFRVLGLKSFADRTRRMDLTGSILCLTAALLSGHALLNIAHPTVHASANIGSIAVAQQSAPATAAPQSSSAQSSSPQPSAKPSASRLQSAPTRPQDHSVQTQLEPEPAASGSYIDGMRAALGDLTVDQLISLKIQGVTPAYIRGLREQGLHPNAENVLAMRNQGVTPEYVEKLRAIGIPVDDERVVAMKIQGVDADYVQSVKEAGVQPGVDRLISMKIQGVTADYIRGFHEQGLQPSDEEIVSLRIQGATPEFVRDLHALGFKPTVDQVLSMQIQGVTPEYIKSLQAAGYKPDIEEIISARIQGVTEDFMQRAAKHGFKNLTLPKLIQLKQVGILDSATDL